LTAWRCRRARLTFHQEIQDAVAARERLALVVGPIAALSEYVPRRGRETSGVPRRAQFALQADKAVTPILRQGDYPSVPDELKLLDGGISGAGFFCA
jgi:hypothetical protein